MKQCWEQSLDETYSEMQIDPVRFRDRVESIVKEFIRSRNSVPKDEETLKTAIPHTPSAIESLHTYQRIAEPSRNVNAQEFFSSKQEGTLQEDYVNDSFFPRDENHQTFRSVYEILDAPIFRTEKQLPVQIPKRTNAVQLFKAERILLKPDPRHLLKPEFKADPQPHVLNQGALQRAKRRQRESIDAHVLRAHQANKITDLPKRTVALRRVLMQKINSIQAQMQVIQCDDENERSKRVNDFTSNVKVKYPQLVADERRHRVATNVFRSEILYDSHNKLRYESDDIFNSEIVQESNDNINSESGVEKTTTESGRSRILHGARDEINRLRSVQSIGENRLVSKILNLRNELEMQYAFLASTATPKNLSNATITSTDHLKRKKSERIMNGKKRWEGTKFKIVLLQNIIDKHTCQLFILALKNTTHIRKRRFEFVGKISARWNAVLIRLAFVDWASQIHFFRSYIEDVKSFQRKVDLSIVHRAIGKWRRTLTSKRCRIESATLVHAKSKTFMKLVFLMKWKSARSHDREQKRNQIIADLCFLSAFFIRWMKGTTAMLLIRQRLKRQFTANSNDNERMSLISPSNFTTNLSARKKIQIVLAQAVRLGEQGPIQPLDRFHHTESRYEEIRERNTILESDVRHRINDEDPIQNENLSKELVIDHMLDIEEDIPVESMAAALYSRRIMKASFYLWRIRLYREHQRYEVEKMFRYNILRRYFHRIFMNVELHRSNERSLKHTIRTTTLRCGLKKWIKVVYERRKTRQLVYQIVYPLALLRRLFRSWKSYRLYSRERAEQMRIASLQRISRGYFHRWVIFSATCARARHLAQVYELVEDRFKVRDALRVWQKKACGSSLLIRVFTKAAEMWRYRLQVVRELEMDSFMLMARTFAGWKQYIFKREAKREAQIRIYKADLLLSIRLIACAFVKWRREVKRIHHLRFAFIPWRRIGRFLRTKRDRFVIKFRYLLPLRNSLRAWMNLVGFEMQMLKVPRTKSSTSRTTSSSVKNIIRPTKSLAHESITKRARNFSNFLLSS